MPNKYVYGPVPSRRLGYSLGIDIIPFKNCTFNCIYCQLGKTTKLTIERKEYTPADEIVEEVKDAINTGNHIDYLTFSGSGEPTLHSRIGYLIEELKKTTQIPIAVLTNGSLLLQSDVQMDLLSADVVLPTLSSATSETFEEIHRCHSSMRLDKIIQGQIEFRKLYKGKIWLEVMLIKGINDKPEELKKLRMAIEKIRPDKVHLNTVVRPPSERHALALSLEELQKVAEFFGPNCEIVAEFREKREITSSTDQEAILNLIRRRPVTLDDIINTLVLNKAEALKYLDALAKAKKIKITQHNNQEYYEALDL